MSATPVQPTPRLVAKLAGLALVAFPALGAGMYVAFAFVAPTSDGVLIAAAAGLAVVVVAAVGWFGHRWRMPRWLTATAAVVALPAAAFWLFAEAFGVIAVACTQFNELCLG